MEHPSQLLDMLDFEEAVQADLAPLQDMALGAKLLPASPLLSEDDVQPAAADEDVEGPQAFLAAAGTVFEEYEADGEAEDEVVEAASDDSVCQAGGRAGCTVTSWEEELDDRGNRLGCMDFWCSRKLYWLQVLLACDLCSVCTAERGLRDGGTDPLADDASKAGRVAPDKGTVAYALNLRAHY